tara:strand:- start:1122 stop:1694 length:573 start_codon:yes stop_codon:yes gene_type:complete
MMRVIGGCLKGKKILLPIDKNTRPLRDLVKESIFNLLKHSKKLNFDITDSNILDLFSGSGSFGIECISRGAKKVTFIESYVEGIKILKKNIINLNMQKKTDIVCQDCFKYLENIKKPNEKYDLIFLDPPFKEKKINQLIKEILNKNFLNKNGILITHRYKKDEILMIRKLRILETRKYGISKIIFGKWVI